MNDNELIEKLKKDLKNNNLTEDQKEAIEYFITSQQAIDNGLMTLLAKLK